MIEVVVRKAGKFVLSVPVTSRYAAKKQARRLLDKYDDSFVIEIVNNVSNEQMKENGNEQGF